MQTGVQNVTIVSTPYEQKKSLFNYTNYKYKTKIGRGKRKNIRKWTGLRRIYITNEPEIMFL